MSNFIDKFSLAGKKAIVIGSIKGLCNRMAQTFHDARAEVALLDILDMVEDSAGEMAERGPMMHAVKGDLTKTKGLKNIHNKCLESLGGRVDILLNGAGIQFKALAVGFPHDRWEKTTALNMNVVFYMSQLVGKTTLAQKYGRIINMASMTAFFISVLIPAYSASKGGMAQITKAPSNEWAGQGASANAIAPGYVITELTANIKEVNPKQCGEITSRIPMGC